MGHSWAVKNIRTAGIRNSEERWEMVTQIVEWVGYLFSGVAFVYATAMAVAMAVERRRERC